MQRSADRFITTHTGSLPRPESLTKLFIDRSQGKKIDAASLAVESRSAVEDIVRKQSAAGIDVGNNGEQPRDSFFLYLTERLTGLGGHWDRPSRADVDRYPEFKKRYVKEMTSAADKVNTLSAVPTAISDVAYIDEDAIAAECRELRDVLGAQPGAFAEAFMSSPSPGFIASSIRNDHYDSQERYLEAIGKALRVEYKAIVDHGFILQVDAPDLALERHITYKDEPLSRFLEFVERVVSTINTALEGIPRDRVRIHVCWGNSESPHDSDVALSDILPVIRKADVGGFVLPFANPRHAHEYKCFKDLPLADDQILVAGVIDSLTNFVEHPEVIADRIERVVHVVGDKTRVLVGTDCGFDTSAGWGRVASDVVWGKFRAMREGADIASRRFFK